MSSRYIAALRVASPWRSDGGLQGYSTRESTYAIAEHTGPISGIGKTLREFDEWLEGSGYDRSAGAEIEVYPDEYNPTGMDSVMETWIPVVGRL